MICVVDIFLHGALLIEVMYFLQPPIWKTFHLHVATAGIFKACVERRDWNVKMHRWHNVVIQRLFTGVVVRMVEVSVDKRGSF